MARSLSRPFVMPRVAGRLAACTERFVATIASISIVASAFAGYTISYSGGTGTVHNPQGTQAYAYTLTSGGYGGGYEAYPWGWVSCSGQITTTLTWSGTDPRPSAIVIQETSTASGDTIAADGFGDPDINGTSSGARWSFIQNPAATVTITCSPNAYSGASGGNSAVQPDLVYGLPADADVFYSVILYPITMDFTGPTQIGGAQKLIVGQKLQAIVNTHGLPAKTGDLFTWSQPSAGRPFGNYVASLSSATYTALTVPGPSGTPSTLSCFFGQPDVTANITCTFHSGQFGVDIPVAATLTTDKPTWQQVLASIGTMQLMYIQNFLQPNEIDAVYQNGNPSTPNPTRFMLWGATDGTGITSGILHYDRLTDPTGYGNERGQFGYVQLYGLSPPPPPPAHYDGDTFPYPIQDPITLQHVAGVWPSWGGNQGTFRDRPSIAITGQSGQVSDYFNLYIFYQAPSDTAGQSVWIPIWLKPWTALGIFSTSDGVTWTQMDTGSAIGARTDYPSPFPTW
ncbi:MAG: hypothetical protein HYR64_07375 [Fimbriimonas ginsengisoli]|uniref:Uncharacterized protein n=1 Tax=Fimbriimonas ginsengisoli TaxID=1005039 RepID=A0A931LVE4_FIMGI|nr:hypothetical protein [Fimbriimonas ginsengisoli]